ncbi:MAG: (Fe-S)-binding protein [Calditrichales bacterium]|nr:MAG: (Fe-S)-binding protein [Calditrichales bacterium]
MCADKLPTNFLAQAPLPSYDQLVNCMHCGMCLPTCPTYSETGMEINSPRGRIHLIRAVADGKLGITDRFKESIEYCLNCQACVTSCPAGVRYGQLVEAAQLQIAAHEKVERGGASLREKIMDWLFADLRRLNFVGRLMGLYQKIGFQSLVQASGILKLISQKLHEMSFMTPTVSAGRKYRAKSRHQSRGKVGILIGCVQDVFFKDVNQDTIDVLEYNGYEVFIPAVSYCCGSVHGHNGNAEMARELAVKLMNAFDTANVDHIVLNSAGCGAYMKEYGELFENDPLHKEMARKFSGKVKDITEFLTENGWQIPQNPGNMKVTYHEPCHLVHSQKVSEQPRKIIGSIPGIEFIDLPEATWCCGSAGIYNILRYEDSMKVLERKMRNIQQTGADWIITGNPGCMIQLMYGVKKYNLNMRVIHPVTLLKMAYQERENK